VAPELNAKSLHQWPGKIPIVDHVTDRANHAKFHPAPADAAGWEVFSTDGHYFMGGSVRNFMDNSVDTGNRRHLSRAKWSQVLRSGLNRTDFMHEPVFSVEQVLRAARNQEWQINWLQPAIVVSFV